MECACYGDGVVIGNGVSEAVWVGMGVTVEDGVDVGGMGVWVRVGVPVNGRLVPGSVNTGVAVIFWVIVADFVGVRGVTFGTQRISPAKMTSVLRQFAFLRASRVVEYARAMLNNVSFAFTT